MKNKNLYWAMYLILIVAIQYIVRFFIIRPEYVAKGISLQIPEWIFALIVFATLCIALGSFFIVSYYKDRQSKPFSQSDLQKSDKRYIAFFVFSFIGCGLGLFAGWKIQFFNLGVLYIIYATILYFYALRYRLLAFWGNFILGLIPVLLILNIWLFEFFALRNNPMDLGIIINSPVFSSINASILLYASFCFVLIFAQQIVKDIITSPQAPSGSEIFAIRYGIQNTKKILVATLILLLAISICFVFYFMGTIPSYFLVGGVFIGICELLLLFKAFKCSTIEDFKSLEYLFDVLVILGVFVFVIR